MATPEQLLQAIPNRNGYVLVEHARPPGSDFGHYGSSAPATSKFVLGELQRILNQPRFSSIDLRDQVSGDLSKLVGSGNYGLVHEGTMGAEHKRVAVKVVRYGDKSALPALEVSRFVALFVVMTSESAPESAKRSICLVQA